MDRRAFFVACVGVPLAARLGIRPSLTEADFERGLRAILAYTGRPKQIIISPQMLEWLENIAGPPFTVQWLPPKGPQ